MPLQLSKVIQEIESFCNNLGRYFKKNQKNRFKSKKSDLNQINPIF